MSKYASKCCYNFKCIQMWITLLAYTTTTYIIQCLQYNCPRLYKNMNEKQSNKSSKLSANNKMHERLLI